MENEGSLQNPYINAMCDDNGFTQYGMTLRGYFAAKAMQAMVSRSNANAGWSENDSEQAYYIADTMLKGRCNETI